jgi:hypothetical protein
VRNAIRIYWGAEVLSVALVCGLWSPVQAQTTTTHCSAWGNSIDCTTWQPEPNPLAASLQALAVEQATRAQAAWAAETQAAWAAAGRQAEQAAITAAERAAQTAAAIPTLAQLAWSSPGTLRPLNTELISEWSGLDGVTMSSEYKLDGGIQRRLTAGFALNPTPDGRQFVQLRMDSRLIGKANDGRLAFSGKVAIAREVLDGWYDPNTGVVLLTSSREPLRFDVSPLYESLVLIGEYGFTAKMGGITQGKVPLGVVPSPLLGFVVAAIPGNLADSMSVWVLDWATSNVVLAQLTLQSRMTRWAAFARDGAACGEKTPTSDKKVEVLEYKVRVGAREEYKRFLASAPHLPVSDETTCIDLAR